MRRQRERLLIRIVPLMIASITAEVDYAARTPPVEFHYAATLRHFSLPATAGGCRQMITHVCRYRLLLAPLTSLITLLAMLRDYCRH